ncbi:putative TBC1 domain family member 25 [Apostichopus japonicus]|uniref:Putative TBC1 domain family member 25 n=1 Tax=Stichopus japonicus TaxID=307972 RepID=A0A2G8KHF1_STIJA|nr:putative TBC1 domain family member 25 [Apostichopus japonicus]
MNEFTISYLSRDDVGEDVFLALLSDWDLDAAIFCASDPCLRLRIDAKPFEGPGLLEGWDVIGGQDVPENSADRSRYVPFVGSLVTQVGRTISRVQKIFQNVEEESAEEDQKYELPKPPLDDQEFLTYLNYLGCLEKPHELRLRIYQGGVGPSLRKVVWRHLLNVYPEGLTGNERLDYVKIKTEEYTLLKKKLLSDLRDENVHIRNMVIKDVNRTDRQEQFFAGEDNPNSLKLFNILTTFSLAHPDVSYCQGMSDLAAPILYVLKDEAQAYMCFCCLMKRLKGSFLPDGKAMSVKFLHLTELIRCVDAEFYEYLKAENADDLYFCYRWLLLELKREFSFQDALRMMEIMWSSLPPEPPPREDGVSLEGPPCQNSPSAYTVDRRRFKFSLQKASSRDEALSKDSGDKKKSGIQMSPQKISVKVECSCTGDHCENCREDIIDTSTVNSRSASNSPAKRLAADVQPVKMPPQSLSLHANNSNVNSSQTLSSPAADRPTSPSLSPLRQSPSPLPTKKSPFRGLPHPKDFGGGNPFMMFLCLSLLLEQRDRIIDNKMDFNEMAMLFDRMVRKHNLNRVLHRARTLYSQYLQSEAAYTGFVMVKGINTVIQQSYSSGSPQHTPSKLIETLT